MPQDKSWEINCFLEEVCDALKRLLNFERATIKDYKNTTERQQTLYIVYHGKIMAYLWTLQQIGTLSDKPEKWFNELLKYREQTNKIWNLKNMRPQCSYL